MFMTKEEALTEMQELVATMEAMLERAEDNEDKMEALVAEIEAEYGEIEPRYGEIEAEYEEVLGAIYQLKNISDRYLNVEMRNYTTLTVREARRAIREAEAIA